MPLINLLLAIIVIVITIVVVINLSSKKDRIPSLPFDAVTHTQIHAQDESILKTNFRNCGKELMGTPDYFRYCGVKAPVESKFCPKCGAATNEAAEFCSKCGNPLK